MNDFTKEKLECEKWIAINDYPLYFVSSLGRVKSTVHGKSLILACNHSKNGYKNCTLFNENNPNKWGKIFYVHRLIASHFLVKEKNKEVNHLDGNKLNNRVSNLEWVTRSQNSKHAFDIGLKKPTIQDRSAFRKRIIQTDLSGKIIKEWSSISEAVSSLGLSRSAICNVLLGRTKKSGNFIWRYANE